jgi:hypothetical protein
MQRCGLRNKTGVGEKRVRELLGRPSWELTEKRDIELYLSNPECAKVSVKILAYDRRLREDVLVGINAKVWWLAGSAADC